jgi:hypothetical protein
MPDILLEAGALAVEVLGLDYQLYAERLAQVSHDTPLITVAGGRLIARGQIAPELLNTVQSSSEMGRVAMQRLSRQINNPAT